MWRFCGGYSPKHPQTNNIQHFITKRLNFDNKTHVYILMFILFLLIFILKCISVNCNINIIDIYSLIFILTQWRFRGFYSK